MNEFKIIFNPTIEHNISAFECEFCNYQLAKVVLNTVANYTLYLHDQSLMHDYSNIGLIVQMVDGEWIEIDEEDELLEQEE